MPRQINNITVTMTPSAGRARLADAAVPRSVCPLRVHTDRGQYTGGTSGRSGTRSDHQPDSRPGSRKGAFAIQPSVGIAAAEAGRLSEAITILTLHAERSDATANYTLGLIYMRGTGDAATAARLSHRHFKNAAQRGHVGAVFEVAFQFERGIGTERDVKRAIRLYRLAAQSNHLNA